VFTRCCCVYALLLLLNLAVPFGVQVVVHVLGADAVRAERDELTGLLTRRAFRRRAKARLGQGRDQLAHVVITMIDLDRFKQLNDNYGHRPATMRWSRWHMRSVIPPTTPQSSAAPAARNS
jgi:predicted signal transduction protein with EAL and GGDEF domain